MKYSILLITFLMVFSTMAQEREFKYGKVSKEEVAESQHPLEPETEAAILYKRERVYYQYDSEDGFKTIRNAHYRIKIYDKAGLDWGTVKVPLYTSKNGEEKISGIKGMTYNLENGKIVTTKLKKEGVFKENVNKYRNKASIALPGVKEGSVLELQYTVTSDFAGNIDDFQFQYGVPVNKVEVKIEIPEYYVFKRYSRGFYPIDIKQSGKSREISYRYRQESDPGRFNGGVRTGNLKFSENVYEIDTKNVPSLKQVDYTDNINNYRSAVKFELASTRFPNSSYKNYSFTWEDVAKSIYKYSSFGDQLEKTRDIEEVVDAIVEKNADRQKLVKDIYDHVKNHMTWNDYYGVGCENGFKKAYEQKKGNVADINLMLTAMLRHAGFKADPVLVSTKSHGIPLFPTNEGFNYVVAAVEDETGAITLMDATEKMGAVGILPPRAINWKGRLIRKDGTSKEVSLSPQRKAVQIISINANILEDGTVEGNLLQRVSDGLAFEYRDSHKNQTLDEIMETMENRYLEMEVDDLQIKNRNDCEKPVVESCNFRDENQVEAIAGELYFKPALFKATTENPFKLEKREYPVDFTYPWSQRIIIKYTLPKGYRVESLPEKVSLALPDGLGTFNYGFVQNEMGLQFSCITSINSGIVAPIYYEALKEFYNRLVVKHAERVVLSRV